MGSKHTSGPWHWVNPATDEPWDGVSDVFEASLRTVRKSEPKQRDGHTDFALPEWILDAEGVGPSFGGAANARLIAAAPELLDLLEAWVELVERTRKTQSLFIKLEANSSMDFMQALNDTRALIAKAKGET